MGTYVLEFQILSKNFPREAKKELEELDFSFYYPSIDFMLRRGLKYLPAILCSALRAKTISYEWGEDLTEPFNHLKRKVNVKVVKYYHCLWRGELRAKWPIRVLGLKEVSDEMNWILENNIVMEKDKEDAKLLKKWLKHSSYIEEKKKDALKHMTEDVNIVTKEWVKFLMKAYEVHKRYSVTFWMRVIGPL